MEILNNHQMLKPKRKGSFHYSLSDPSLPSEQKNPATIHYYSISRKDLILTHVKYNDLRLDATDSLTEWKLINVYMTDCDKKKLSRLIHDRRINEIAIIEIKNGKKLVFYNNREAYIFRCEEIEQEVRGYNRDEIADMLLEKEDYINQIEKQSIKLNEILTRFSRFVNGESRDHKNLLEFNQDRDISLATKSAHFLEVLSRVKDKMEDLKTTLL